MKKLLSLFSAIILFYSGHGQNLTAIYHVEREVLGLPDGLSHPPLSLTGYYFKKNNRIISFLKPDYLKHFPDGQLRFDERNLTVGLFTDTTQMLFAADLDSMVFRYRYPIVIGESENAVHSFDIDFRSWEIKETVETMYGMRCTYAIQYDFNGTILAEIWYNPELPIMPIGPANLLNVPGLIVKAKLYGTRQTYSLTRFSTTDEIDDSVFWPKEFDYRFLVKNPLKKRVRN